jgi:hypothetical protein
MAQRFIVALNVGTRGYFYWFLPQHTRRYFEKLSDLSTGEQLRVERNPVLEIDWGKKDALNDEDLARTAIVFGFVLRQHKHPAFDHYLLGLALLSKTDIHTRLEAQAVEEFFVALCEGMRLFGDWDGNEPVLTACARAFGDLLEPSELEQFVSKGAHARGDVSLTLSDAGMMKLVCDAYLFRKAEQIYRSTLNRKN